jgi:hypothetical protein
MDERSCAECGFPFAYDAEFYVSRHLLEPTRCRKCRGTRLARRVQVRGHVVDCGPRFALVATEGQVYFTGRLDLPRGSPVTFYIDPEEVVTVPKHRAHAWDVLPAA